MDAQTETFDLDAYLVRIGYAGPRAPTLEALAALQLAHVVTPYEPPPLWMLRAAAAEAKRNALATGRGGIRAARGLRAVRLARAKGDSGWT